MGEVGLSAVSEIVPKLRQNRQIDLVIAQGENVTEGKGITPEDFQKIKSYGVDFLTGGNWSLFRPEAIPLLNNAEEPIIRPANYPEGTPGLGYKYATTSQGKVLVISLLGHVVGRDA
ncbi:MAG: YmdB family metallophosphoesterase, partial [Candidatus Micrarchaeaceae archaeon]